MKWKKGDVIEINFDMPVYTESTPDNPNRMAIKVRSLGFGR